MPSQTLLFCRPGPQLRLAHDEVARELIWGEEVEGLVDLPVRQIIDRLKEAFGDHEERPGLLLARASKGSFEATWTWQQVRIECRGILAEDRERISEVLESFGCVLLRGTQS